MPEPDDFMTVAEIASILKLNQQTVRNWIDSGLLPALHVGRRVPVRRADFDAVIEASMIGNPQLARVSIWDGKVLLPEIPADL
jgi:excisionase family DNA binding protein